MPPLRSPAPWAGLAALLAASASHAQPLLAEAEDFRPAAAGCWAARPWGTNYYAATLANTFLSRKAYLGAPEQCEGDGSATLTVRVPAAGAYLALVRYEAVHRFETRFRLQIRQGGTLRLDRMYGARANPKIWAFGQKVRPEAVWEWGAVENVVWEGHDAAVALEAGEAELTLVAGQQPGPAARRNVDCVLLTPDATDVTARIETEGYLPLDGLLTQTGDLVMRVTNSGAAPLTLDVPAGTEHSPYWVHKRAWKPLRLAVAPNAPSEWTPVGQLLDTLNDGQWHLAGTPGLPYKLEFAVPRGDGGRDIIRVLDGLTGVTRLAYDADTRVRRRIRTAREVLEECVAHLRREPAHGKTPVRTPVFGLSFDRIEGDAGYNALVTEFNRLSGANALASAPDPSGIADVRHVPTPMLAAECERLKARGGVTVVSLGDEIGLESPPAVSGEDRFSARRRAHAFGLAKLRERTDIITKILPGVGVGANVSPHHGAAYLGETALWYDAFRTGALTLPWGEDYVFQSPVCSQQATSIVLDRFRAAARHVPGSKVHYYVMPHWPGNTPASWRRQLHMAVGLGVKQLNLFEYRPVQAAYTENHVSSLEMMSEVRRGLHEVGVWEDILQDGTVERGEAGLWHSEAGDVWDDQRPPFGPAKRCLALAARHRQLRLEAVHEGDDLSPVRVVYLTDAHVSRRAAADLAAWVRAGGRLFASAGAGERDEFDRPNAAMRDLLGVESAELALAPGEPIRWEKTDLPFAAPARRLVVGGRPVPAFGATEVLRPAPGVTVAHRFEGGDPAVLTRTLGAGRVVRCGFLPGLSAFHPAIPPRPADRGTTDDAMNHLVPSRFDAAASELVGLPAEGVPRQIECSEPLVQATRVRSNHGDAVVLVNWSGRPVANLEVRLSEPSAATRVTLASGRPARRLDGAAFALDIDAAEVLVLRP